MFSFTLFGGCAASDEMKKQQSHCSTERCLERKNRVSTMSCLYYLNISFPVQLLGLATFKSYEAKSRRKKNGLTILVPLLSNSRIPMLEE